MDFFKNVSYSQWKERVSACHTFLKSLQLSTFIPQQCCLCYQSSSALCCQVCEADLPTTHALQTDGQTNLLLNPRIKSALAKPEFHQLIVPMRYCWPVSTLIQDLKYRRKDKYVHLFSQWMLPCLHNTYGDELPDLLVPVPIHPLRRLQRHYNQAELLAQHLASKLAIPVSPYLCKRHKHQSSQTGLSGSQRRKQMDRSFAINPVVAESLALLAPNHIAVVDDVVTTASTVNAVVKTLKSHFPTAQIDVWAVAISA